MTGHVRLDELVLRLPGVDRAEARAIGEAVARRVGERLAGSTAVRAGGLDLEVRVRAGTPIDRLVEEVADQVLARITGGR